MNGNILEQSWQNWDFSNNQWANERKNTFSYNDNGNRVEKFSQLWDASLNQWVNNYVNNNTYDINENISESLDKIWNKTYSAWINNWRSLYKYVQITPIINSNTNSHSISKAGLKINNHFVQISVNKPDNKKLSVYIYDVKGRLINMFRSLNKMKNVVNWYYNDNKGNKVSKGLYLIVISNTKKLLSIKVIYK